MTSDDSLQDICDLIDLYPDCHSAMFYRSPIGLLILFRCVNPSTMARLIDRIGWANLPVWIDGLTRDHEDAVRAPDLAWTMHLTVRIDDGDPTWEGPPSQAEVMGIMLLRDLRNHGIMSEARSRELHDQWNAAPEW